MFVGFALALGAGAAQAAEGVIQINHQRATAGGVTAGDAAGYPVTISESGSYRLTGNLTLADENTDGIEITADGVTVDLNGFEIAGSTTCSAFVCSPLGTGDGITSTAAAVTVKNGAVQGAGGSGIVLTGPGSRVRDVTARYNGAAGISVQNSLISGCSAMQNGGVGLVASLGSRVEGSNSLTNALHGISLLDSTAEGNAANGNNLDGINAIRSVVVNNVTSFNGDTGIDIADQALAMGNVAHSNVTYGINCTGTAGGCAMIDNVVTNNNVGGLNASIETGYKGNVINGNTATVTGGQGVQLGLNYCDNNTTCP
jgi:hypothetical protein